MSSQSKHPPAPIWTPQNHFGFCGPHCFCCRALAGYTHTVCSVCIDNLKNKSVKINNDIKIKNYKNDTDYEKSNNNINRFEDEKLKVYIKK